LTGELSLQVAIKFSRQFVATLNIRKGPWITKLVETKIMPTIQTIVAATFLSENKKSLNEAILRNGPRILWRVGFLLLCFHLSDVTESGSVCHQHCGGFRNIRLQRRRVVWATSAALRSPHGVAVDSQGNLYFADRDNEPNPQGGLQTGIITTVAGKRVGRSWRRWWSCDYPPNFSFPLGVRSGRTGQFVFIADRDNNRIRKVTAAGVISTVAGSGVNGFSGDGGLGHCRSPLRPGKCRSGMRPAMFTSPIRSTPASAK
jgi:hypothetical protein